MLPLPADNLDGFLLSYFSPLHFIFQNFQPDFLLVPLSMQQLYYCSIYFPYMQVQVKKAKKGAKIQNMNLLRAELKVLRLGIHIEILGLPMRKYFQEMHKGRIQITTTGI